MTNGTPPMFSRRGFLTVGTMGFGLTLADYFRLRAHADLENKSPIPVRADSVIHIYLPGGIAHQETFARNPSPRSSTAASWGRWPRRSTVSGSARPCRKSPRWPTSSASSAR